MEEEEQGECSRLGRRKPTNRSKKLKRKSLDSPPLNNEDEDDQPLESTNKATQQYCVVVNAKAAMLSERYYLYLLENNIHDPGEEPTFINQHFVKPVQTTLTKMTKIYSEEELDIFPREMIEKFRTEFQDIVNNNYLIPPPLSQVRYINNFNDSLVTALRNEFRNGVGKHFASLLLKKFNFEAVNYVTSRDLGFLLEYAEFDQNEFKILDIDSSISGMSSVDHIAGNRNPDAVGFYNSSIKVIVEVKPHLFSSDSVNTAICQVLSFAMAYNHLLGKETLALLLLSSNAILYTLYHPDCDGDLKYVNFKQYEISTLSTTTNMDELPGYKFDLPMFATFLNDFKQAITSDEFLKPAGIDPPPTQE